MIPFVFSWRTGLLLLLMLATAFAMGGAMAAGAGVADARENISDVETDLKQHFSAAIDVPVLRPMALSMADAFMASTQFGISTQARVGAPVWFWKGAGYLPILAILGYEILLIRRGLRRRSR